MVPVENLTASIVGLLQQQVTVRPEGVAIADLRQGRSLTFAQLEHASDQVARQLQQAGLKPGEAALVLQPMSAQLYVVLLALFRLGAVAMFIDPAAGLEHLERCCALYPPHALIASPKAHLLQVKSSALRHIPLKFSVGLPFPFTGQVSTKMLNFFETVATRSPQKSPTAHLAYYPTAQRWIVALPSLSGLTRLAPKTPTPLTSTAALLTFTSGSTGQPKAALRTHEFLLAQHRVLASSLSLTAGDVDLTTLPIFVLANLASGVTSLIPSVDLRYPGKIDGTAVMRQIQRHQPTSTAASPAFLERLVDACDRHSTQLPSLRRIFSGGAPVFPKLLERVQAIAPQAQVTAVYGSTEAEPIAHIAYHDLQPVDRTNMISGSGLLTGHPVAELQLRILSDQWGTPIQALTQAEFAGQCLAAGGVGEIVVSGNHVLPGYLHGQGDAETKFRVDGIPWHRTGDAGYLDAQGRLWLLGRCSAQLGSAAPEAAGAGLDSGLKIPSEMGVSNAGVSNLSVSNSGDRLYLFALYPFAVEAAAHHQPGVRRTALVSHRGRRVLLIEWEPQGEAKYLEDLQRSLRWAAIQEFRSCRQIPMDKRHNAKVDYPALYRLLTSSS